MEGVGNPAKGSWTVENIDSREHVVEMDRPANPLVLHVLFLTEYISRQLCIEGEANVSRLSYILAYCALHI